MATLAAARGLATTVAARRHHFEVWPDGPAVGPEEAKAYTVRLEDYLVWASRVDGSAPTRADFRDNVRRLRRMAYSRFTKGVGARFDALFDTEKLEAPLTTARVSRGTLDRLYTTGNFMSSSPFAPYTGFDGAPVDTSHLFVGIDFAFNRRDFNKWRLLAWAVDPGLGAEFDRGIMGLVTWVGDLASWFVEWNSERIKADVAGKTWTAAEAEAQRAAILVRKMSLEDLLSDMDGQVLGVRAVTTPGLVRIEDLLRAYYLDPPHPGVPHVTTRFASFVRVSQPPIPHTDTGGVVKLSPDAVKAVASAMTGVAWLFLFIERRGRLGSSAAAESAHAEVTAHAAVVTAMAADFVQFLGSALAGGTPAWPSAHLHDLGTRYGGYYLQPGDSDATKTYGGVVRSGDPGGRVKQLHDDLVLAGYTCLPAPDTAEYKQFTRATQWALRHLQGYASLEGTAGVLVPMKGPRTGDALEHLHNPRRYYGPAHGLLDPETATTLVRWRAPTTGRRGTAPGVVMRVQLADRLHCPVVMEAWNWKKADAATTFARDNIWLRDDPDVSDAVWARDASGYYDIPPAQLNTKVDGVLIGSMAEVTGMGKGPITRNYDPVSVWAAETRVNPTRLTGADIDPATQPAHASTYRVVAAVAHLECGDYLDSLNGWDSAIVSMGAAHWTIRPAGKTGELFAFLAYVRRKHPAIYERYLGVFGVYPALPWPQTWPNAMWERSSRKYVCAPVIFGLPDASGNLQRDFAAPVTHAEDFERFRDWHWWYRFVMMCRNSPEIWRCQWDMARTRIRDILLTPWAASTGANVPTAPAESGGTRPATFGEVFTSEHAVALVYRYHVNYPNPIISGGHAGSKMRAAIKDANLTTMDTTAWGEVEAAAILAQLRLKFPASFADVGNKWDSWRDPTFGATYGGLQPGHGTFRLMDEGLPIPM